MNEISPLDRVDPTLDSTDKSRDNEEEEQQQQKQLSSNSDKVSISELDKQNESSSQISLSSMKVLNENMGNQEQSAPNTEEEVVLDHPEQTIKHQIISAAQHGDINILKFYLIKSTENPNPHSPNLTDSDGITLVHWAALNNKLSTIKFLVSIGANPDIAAGDMHATPLLWAVRYGLVYVADYLIRDAKVRVNVIDNNGIGILLASVFSSNIMMVIYVIWTLNNIDDSEITNVGRNGIDTVDEKKRTSLHWAAYQGDFLTVDILLAAGAKIDLVDAEGFTPLHWGLVGNSKSVVSSLLAAKCNIDAKTGDGKTAWNVASDMKCSTMWASVLTENNRDPVTGNKIQNFVSEDLAKTLIFLLPFASLPLTFLVFSSSIGILVKIIMMIILLLLQQLLLKKVLFTSYNCGKININRSPLLSGVFASTVCICLIIWLLKIVPYTIMDENIANLIFTIGASGVIFFFIKSMTLDPGYIPRETDDKAISDTIYELIKLRKFDSHHYCIYTNIRKPLRSKYSKDKKANIARFDHYCPWVNNNIGVRNHKVFIAFTLSLEISILCWVNLTLEYFDNLPEISEKKCGFLSEDLCSGYYGSKFTFFFFWWVVLQLFWLSVLLIVQFIQISKGSTTYEFSHIQNIQSNENTFSSVPTDDSFVLNDTVVDEDEGDSDENLETNLSQSLFSNGLNTETYSQARRFFTFPLFFISKIASSKLCRMVGLDQMVILTNDLIQKNSSKRKQLQFNYGFSRNWLDFLFLRRIGDNYSFRTLIALPIKGENNLNDVLVDYYNFYVTPETV
ncbi:palmitoyltransferase akr1 [Pichia californica]|uniref:Palmitoyltransferase n=1 Tax=Pichia californica TaxID=460514 RepID=A0A9P6WMK9_9ASCO|nr:palmitoyltransferase akr1 [[Candida] californica]KAG0689696.1 palmitoyltransferase akr1 [[Candida] californica]